MKNKTLGALAAMFLLFCPSAPAQSATAKDAGQAINAFALDLYNQARSEPGNIFFSPYSISGCMAMAYAGAKTTTAEEIAGVMHYACGQNIHPGFKALNETLNQAAAFGDIELNIANSLWAEQSFDFYHQYLELVKINYANALEKVDFKHDYEQVRIRINSWVEEKTKRRIKDLLPGGSLNDQAHLVLTNAIYFKGKWAAEFKKEDTKDMPFYLTPDNPINATMMTQNREYAYKETNDVQILALPYRGEKLSMVVILPKEKNGINAVENALDSGKLNDLITLPDSRKVIVYLPKFKTAPEIPLKKSLVSLGMKETFSNTRADFSGMANVEKGVLYIGDIFHKAFVEVNEEGTEAAAATGEALMHTDSESVFFQADHPFIFVIKDNTTNTILFMGRVSDPGINHEAGMGAAKLRWTKLR
jgi:serpin B